MSHELFKGFFVARVHAIETNKLQFLALVPFKEPFLVFLISKVNFSHLAEVIGHLVAVEVVVHTQGYKQVLNVVVASELGESHGFQPLLVIFLKIAKSRLAQNLGVVIIDQFDLRVFVKQQSAG